MTNYTDHFAQNGLPTAAAMPQLIHLENPLFQVPDLFNCTVPILDDAIEEGFGDAPCLYSFDQAWTYRDLVETSNKIAHYLIDDLHLEPGNRVLLRSANNPMMVACWFAVLKAGGIVVATMPLLRAKELTTIVECAEISIVLCDRSLADEIHLVKTDFIKQVSYFGGGDLEEKIKNKSTEFTPFATRSTDIALIGFTSGTTGLPKMTAHYHRDVWAICQAFPAHALQPSPQDIFTGSPPIGFTFGLGGLVLFPLRYRASTFLIEKPSPDLLLQAIQQFNISICFTAPTAWRILATKVAEYNVTSLRKCISAGENLPIKIWQEWKEATGLSIIDGIGSTELLHIFISSDELNMRPGATGKPIPGYEAKIVDEQGGELPANEIGRLAVRGITGCKYLNRPDKQQEYVQHGWNITGDLFKKDEDGFFWFVARGDDMIISSGYNIAAIEVESVLLQHPEVAECAVVGVPDEERGMLVAAHIVLKNHQLATEEYKNTLQHWFKAEAAPYKYPRLIYFCDQLPKTETGKIQRFKLKTP
jgi:2-aminobenzoate-CoA ligase